MFSVIFVFLLFFYWFTILLCEFLRVVCCLSKSRFSRAPSKISQSNRCVVKLRCATRIDHLFVSWTWQTNRKKGEIFSQCTHTNTQEEHKLKKKRIVMKWCRKWDWNHVCFSVFFWMTGLAGFYEFCENDPSPEFYRSKLRNFSLNSEIGSNIVSKIWAFSLCSLENCKIFAIFYGLWLITTCPEIVVCMAKIASFGNPNPHGMLWIFNNRVF